MSASTRNTIARILQVLVGLAFIFFGVKKFMDLPATVGMFGSLGLPGALAYVIAAAELLGGIGLLIPRFVRPAALGLVLIMLGAVVMHATKIPGGLAGGMAAIVLLVLLIVILVLSRPATTPVG
ncbi:DoxX family protein [Hymenobacter rubripertinctus]|uniref:DoxX family membrane protein n=1 Tax=Hymenobacter rubripertinctus TaxID=2029981 RepID=A0A418R8D3_9BACT|nr:DoxX family protein [Hymenobacter rubripertinctus]RIY13798.1 DoxX family membrane protein [Hymenobacter rubripertinctus]